MSHVRRWIADRPWLFVVAGLAVFLTMSLTFLLIALAHPPHLLP